MALEVHCFATQKLNPVPAVHSMLSTSPKNATNEIAVFFAFSFPSSIVLPNHLRAIRALIVGGVSIACRLAHHTPDPCGRAGSVIIWGEGLATQQHHQTPDTQQKT